MIPFEIVIDGVIADIKSQLKAEGYNKDVVIYKTIGAAELDHLSNGVFVSKLYGVYRNSVSQISTVSDGLNMLTGSAVIDFIVDAIRDDDGGFVEVDRFVSAINNAAGKITGQYTSLTDDGATYAILPVMSPATVGAYQEESSNWGAYLPVSVQVAFTALEGAVSPSEVILYIDSVRVPTTDLVISRTKSSTADVMSSSANGSTVNTDDSSTLEMRFSAPAIPALTGAITAELYNGGVNIPHVVVIKDRTLSGAINKCYLMEFANIQQTKQHGATVGINVNLLELNQNAAAYPDSSDWSAKTVNVSADTLKGSVTIPKGVYCVFWGDGSANVVNANSGSITMNRPYKEARSYTVRMYRWMGDVS